MHYLTEALVKQGHEVTLYASGDSRTSARLHPGVRESLRVSTTRRDPLAWHVLQLALVAQEAADYDLVHFHTDFLHFPLWRRMSVPQLTTLHGRLNLPDLLPLFEEFSDIHVASISDNQRGALRDVARWAGTVYNGIPAGSYTFRHEQGRYLAFLGRISPEKGPEAAIDIAIRAGIPLKMAAKVDPVDRDYFEARVRDRLTHPLIEYVGEIDEQGKNELLGGALALLFPIDWPEPFGLAMVEAMACGTPVIAYRQGAVPEVMSEGVSGFVVASVDEAVSALDRIDRIDRSACRAYFEQRFTVDHMVRGYLDLYRQLAAPA
ncbi:glycosyltransferase family 4 protein [Guyparkeria hydrothermalis]|nr:glycosyltransferase family 4 protein [Guyparkeria hydrothermalis]